MSLPAGVAQRPDRAVTIRPRPGGQRLGWGGVPFVVQIAVEQRVGAHIINAESEDGGYSMGMAARLDLADGRRVFVKGVPAAHPAIGSYYQEARTMSRLPPVPSVPTLLEIIDDEWFVLVFDYVAGAPAQLGVDSPDLRPVLDAYQLAHSAFTPARLPGIPSARAMLGPALRGWTELITQPDLYARSGSRHRDLGVTLTGEVPAWAVRNLDNLAAIETAWQPWADGATLLHADVRPEKLLRRDYDGQVLISDWAHPAIGAPWLDIVSLVPHMLLAGHDPESAERWISGRPELIGVPAWAITGFAAGLAGYWTVSSGRPEPGGVVGLRRSQARWAAAALLWTAHRTRWA
jgi:aminoglycoside phosphotransferase (APT) family kinase protein